MALPATPGATILATDINTLVDVIGMRHFGGFPSMVTGYMDQTCKMNSDATYNFIIEVPTKELQLRDIRTDWASAAVIWGMVVIGLYVYVYVRDASNNYRVYRFLISNVAAGGTLMTISGQAFGTSAAQAMMTSNGTDFFFNMKAGNSASSNIISRYTISGTTLTYVADITCGATTTVAFGFLVDASINIWGISSADQFLRKYNSSGTLQYTTNYAISTPTNYSLLNFLGVKYAGYGGAGNDNNRFEKFYAP